VRTPLVRIVLLALAVVAAGATGAPRAAVAAPETLLLAIWSNYLPESVIADFEKEANCTVEIPWNYGSNDELLAKLQTKSTGFDLAVPSDVILEPLVAQGLLEALEKDKLPNLVHLDPAFAKRQADRDGAWSVPYTWGTVGIAWRTDRVKRPVDSWSVFSDASIADGNAYLLEEARDVVGAALLLRGHDLNSTAPGDLAHARETLLAWRKGLKGYTGEVKDHLLSGEAWLIQAYNGDVAQAMQEKPGKYGFVVPKEGGILWIDNLVIPKGAPNKALAHKFIDYVLRPAVAAKISNGIRYAVANKDAIPLVEESIRKDPVIYAPDDVRSRLHQHRDLGADLKKVTDLWAEVRGS